MTLEWPAGWDRTPSSERERTSKFSASRGDTTAELAKEMDRVGAETWRADTGSGSSHTKSNGLPKYSANPDDPGFVLRWQKQGHDHAIACDAYASLDSNMRAVLLYVQDNRHADMRPVQTGQDQFAAARLPSGDEDAITTRPPPHEVLEVSPDASPAVVQAAFRERVKVAHPDQGGSEQEQKLVQWAREQMLEGQEVEQ